MTQLTTELEPLAFSIKFVPSTKLIVLNVQPIVANFEMVREAQKNPMIPQQ